MMKVIFVLALVTLVYGAIVREEVWNKSSLKNGKTHVLLYMKEQINFDKLEKNGVHVHDMKNEDERGFFVMNALKEQAERTQKQTIAFLEQKKQNFETFWVKNAIAVHDASEEIIRELAKSEEIEFINSNEEFAVELEEPHAGPVSNISKSAVEWNVRWIKADEVWKMGFEGNGIVTGVIDTGVEPQHPALKNSYRGTQKDGSMKHDFNWYDADRKVRVPVDANGHGTHCTGTVCGGVDRKIGVAPKAKFIHCRAISGASQASKYLGCYQFFMAPHDLDGKNGDPKLRPHTTSHSYGCGGCRPDDLKEAFEAMSAAGIFLAVSAGNSGPRCSTILRPPGNYASAFSVGALNKESNTIAGFSSRGPITYDRSNRLKPEISAPGVQVVSASNGGKYSALSGTSMASPAVNGAVALLWEAVPALKRDIKKTIAILTKTAGKQPSNDCGTTGSPNNVFGYGGINIHAAVKAAQEMFRKQ